MQVTRRRRRFGRLLALTVLVGLIAAACGSSSKSNNASNDTTTTAASKFVPISGVPGVTDTEIRFAAVGTNSNNPLGTCFLDCILAGVKANFAYHNSQGGIYGRKLVLTDVLDDELGKNQAKSLQIISKNDAFAVFNVPIVATGYAEFAKANWPVYSLITDQVLGAKPNIFSDYSISCVGPCARLDYPYVAKALGATKIAALGYGVAESSKKCAAQIENTFNKIYPASVTGGAKVVYKNDNLAFGFPNGAGPEVTAMKNAGVQLIFACLELNGMKTIATEEARQGLKAPLVHYAGADDSFFKTNASVLDGNIVGTHLRPLFADLTPGQKAFKEWMGKTGGTIDEYAIHGWIVAEMAFEGLKRAGAPFDRQKVIDATNAMKDFTASGWIPPRDIGATHEQPTPTDLTHAEKPFCFSYYKFTNGKFEFLKPLTAAKPYACWPGDTYNYTDPVATTF